MSESPDELLIFKLREKPNPSTDQSTTSKPATKEEPKPQPKPELAITAKPKPMLPPAPAVQAAKPKEEPKPQARPSPLSSILNSDNKPKPSPEIEKAKVVAAPTPQPAPPPPPVKQYKQAPAPQQQIQQIAQQPSDVGYPDPRNYYVPDKVASNISDFNASYKKKLQVKSKSQSRSAAKGLFCAWHPWRRAYSICSYCHRAFCYEDSIEYKNGYYCIEDIDAIEKDYVLQQRSEYNATSLISTGIMLVAFLVFIYYAGPQMIFILNYSWKLGLLGFIGALNLSYALALGALAIMVLSLGVAFYSFSASRRSNIMGIVVGIMAVSLFTYLFITTGTDYLAVMAFLEFLSFMASVYTAANAIKVYDQPGVHAETYDMTFWPNVSKF